MREEELTNTLNIIAANVDERFFNLIIENAVTLLEDERNVGMTMDEAVHVAAAVLYNEELINDAVFRVCDAALDEYANRPATYRDALEMLADSMTEEQFDAFMTECVSYGLNRLCETVTETKDNIARSMITAAKARLEAKSEISDVCYDGKISGKAKAMSETKGVYTLADLSAICSQLP